MIAAADEQVGQVLAALEASGQRDNTIVLFTADHGDNLGSQHLWNKHSVNEEAIRVPFIVSWPSGRLTPRVVDTHVASLADVAPTLLALAGRTVTDERLMFYDLREDTYQLANLAHSDAQAATAGRLRDQAREWNTRTPWMEGSLGGTYGHGP